VGQGEGERGGERERERDPAEGMDFISDGLLTRTHLKKKVPTTLDKLPYIDIHSHGKWTYICLSAVLLCFSHLLVSIIIWHDCFVLSLHKASIDEIL